MKFPSYISAKSNVYTIIEHPKSVALGCNYGGLLHGVTAYFRPYHPGLLDMIAPVPGQGSV